MQRRISAFVKQFKEGDYEPLLTYMIVKYQLRGRSSSFEAIKEEIIKLQPKDIKKVEEIFLNCLQIAEKEEENLIKCNWSNSLDIFYMQSM